MTQTTGAKLVSIEVYDPPMCCATGVCGPEPDTELLAIRDALLQLEHEFPDTVTVARYNLNNDGDKYAQNPEVLNRLREHGVDILPVTLVNGAPVKERSYPTLDELRVYAAR